MPAHVETEADQTVTVHHEYGRHGCYRFAMTPHNRINVVFAPLRTYIGGWQLRIVTSRTRPSIKETRYIPSDRFAHGGVGQVQRVRKGAAKRCK